MQIPEHKYFRLSSGGILKSVDDLAAAMQSMSDSDFQEHVKEHTNDFSNWVIHVFEQKALGEKLREAKSREQAAAVLNEFLEKKKLAEKQEHSSGLAPPQPHPAHKEEPITGLQEKPKKPEGLSSDEFKRFLIRDFVFGILIGLIIGLIIGRLLL